MLDQAPEMLDRSLRDRILDVAEELFYQIGYRAVSMDALAARVGISKKTLYQIFEGKEAIATEAVRRFLGRFTDFTRRQMEEKGDASPLELLRSNAAFAAESVSTFQQAWHADIKRYLPDAWREVELFRAELITGFESLIHQGIEQGLFRDDLNPKLATRMYLAGFEALTDPDALASGEYTAHEAFAHVVTIFFEGIKA